MAFTLINARPSPFGRKVAIALIEKGLPYHVQYDVPWGDQTCTPEYSPLEQLPILIEEDGNCIYDSVYILEWLERRFPERPLLPADTDALLEAKLRQLLGERLMEVFQAIIMENHRPDPSAPWIERQERKVKGVLAELDRMVEHRVIADDRPIDLGDIAIATTLLLCEFLVPAGYCPDIEILRWRGRYPNVTRYVDALAKRPSFVATIPQQMDVDLSATVH
jgi:glutathione S-transferase